MSQARKTKAVADAVREMPTDDHVREIICNTVDELNPAIDALQALASLLRFAETDNANRFLYSPECIGVMVEAMYEAINSSFRRLAMLRGEFLIDRSEHHG